MEIHNATKNELIVDIFKIVIMFAFAAFSRKLSNLFDSSLNKQKGLILKKCFLFSIVLICLHSSLSDASVGFPTLVI